jgi:hypothetical protein
MKKLVIALAALVLAALPARADIIHGIDVMQRCGNGSSTWCYGYVLGVSDGAVREHCMPSGVTAEQMRVIVYRYINARPETWQKPGAFLILDAFKNAWPCN